MKNILIIGIGSLVSMLAIVAVFFALYSTKPEVFGVVPPVDSVQIKLKLKTDQDSLTALTAKKVFEDSIKNIQPKEEAKPLVQALPAAIETKKEVIPNSPTITPVDTTDWKEQAKVLEAMGAENAAKIMKAMADGEVKSIMKNLKKRTAAKILASFEPNRAARILR